jgi:thiamine biosynthesis lipoprotein
MPSPFPPVERARPLLGTTVAIRVEGLSESRAHAAIDTAFAVIARVHDRMNFHSGDSDVARLNRAEPGARVPVAVETHAVLTLAQRIARISGGAFDPTVASDLVREGRIPAPAQARPPDPEARWYDIVVEDDDVHLRRPLWLDLSGIAKGYAVDRAVALLGAFGAKAACVDAGGDLRLFGRPQGIALRTGFPEGTVPVVHLEGGGLACSGGGPDPRPAADGQHRHGATRGATEAGRFTCVLAGTCAVADALTKVVLALGPASGPVLREFDAAAHLRETDGRWHALGDAA